MTRFSILLPLCLAGLAAAEPWNPSLSYDGGGYWDTRLRIEVANPTAQPLRGAPVRVTLTAEGPASALVGGPVASLRAATAGGTELVCGLVDASGAAKRSGVLAAGDTIEAPIEAAPNATAVVYVYAGNEKAWAPPEWLRGDVTNGGFETVASGGAMPVDWTPGSADAAHRISLERAGPHSGQACARCDVERGGTPTWVQYGQGNIAVAPGQKYRFTAWVKAQDVEGKAGWYVHVSGGQDLVVNRVEGWSGTFDWRPLTIEFDVPEDGQTFSCGTVLNGSGTAWYDDAALEPADAVKPSAVAAEKRVLRAIGDAAAWPDDGQWAWRAPLIVRNFAEEASSACMTTFDTRRLRNAVAKVIGFTKTPSLRIVDSEAAPGSLSFAGAFGEDMHVIAQAPAASEKRLWLYVSAGPTEASATPVSLASWSATSMNLLANGSMESGDAERAEAWPPGIEGGDGTNRPSVRRVQGGVAGDWCLELTVPAAIPNPGWNGSRQLVAVKPSTRYLLAGYLKTKGTDSPVEIYGHFLRSDKALTERPFFSTDPPAPSGDHDWTLTSAMVTTPSDCAFLEAHLTMNGHGVVWHDAVTLMEAGGGVAGDLESRAPQAEPLVAWVVNPSVKVFQHDLPPAKPAQEVFVHAARNSREAFQVAVRAREAGALEVTATPLEGPNGATIKAPVVYQAAFVPMDFPIGYDQKTEPAYHRLMPAQRGNDGWPGLWPDPLAVVVEGSTVALGAGKTQPLLFDIDVPADAAPGEYKGAVNLRAVGSRSRATTESVEAPVRLIVWDFVQPEEKHVAALYDLRRGPGMDIAFGGVSPDDATRAWYALLARYNVSPSFVLPSPEFKCENGRVTMESARFDELGRYLLDELHVNAVYTPDFFYACGWAYPPRDIFGLKPFTPEYVSAWTQSYRLFIDHITEKGWRKKFVFYLADEPFDASEVTISGMNRIADMAREIAPDVPVYSSTWRHIAGLDGHLNMWGIGPHGSFAEDARAARRAAGDRFWFTTDGHMCTDTPLLAIERLLPWLCFKYDVEGYEFWGASWWTYNPWQYGWHTHISQSDEGKKYYWVRYPNGDGFLAYPPPGDTGMPCPSIRLVAAREGVDDYELFLALRAYADRGNSAAQRALDQVRSLVTIANQGGRYSTGLMPDPDAVHAARIAAGDTLSRLIRESKAR